MPLESLADRPLLGEADGQPLEEERPPLSRLSIVALVFGVLGSIATFSNTLILFPIIAIALSLLVYWQLARDPSHGGKNLAMIGLGLGVAFVTWTLSATFLRDLYMYEAGKVIAGQFLKILSMDQKYEAFELTRGEGERQIAGTSLERYYEGGSVAPNDPAGTDSQAREAFREFMNAEGSKLVIARGKNARWQFVRGTGVSISGTGKLLVGVEMVDTSTQPEARVKVQLERNAVAINPAASKMPTASWLVRSLTK